MSEKKVRPPVKAVARDLGYYGNRLVQKGERFTISAEDADEIRKVAENNERLSKLEPVALKKEREAGSYIRPEGWIRLEEDLDTDEKKELDRQAKIAADAAKSEAKDGTARRS